VPARGAPLRVAFVGQRAAIDACVPHAPVAGLAPTLIDHRAGDDLLELEAALRAVAPHAVVVFAPGSVPASLLSRIPVAKLGVARDTAETASEGYDRMLAAGAAGVAGPVWRSLALPVDDRLYAAVRPPQGPPRALFIGASSDYRERFLVQAKHRYDLLHYAHGLWGEDLRAALSRVEIGVNVHRDGQPAFEHRVLVHLAAGHLLVSEPLTPAHGLEPEIDYIPVVRADELLTVLDQLERRPQLYERVRLSGRAKAHEHRASRVWPRVLGDLVDDLAAFG
jgi:hypothetical protein